MKKEKDREKDKEKKKKRVKKVSAETPKKSLRRKKEAAAFPVFSNEPLDFFLQAAGGKWKMRILWALREAGSLRYRAIRDKVQGITDMMLSQSLRELTEFGLTIRKQYQEIPPRVEYEITPSGRELLPILESIVAWEERYRPASGEGTVSL